MIDEVYLMNVILKFSGYFSLVNEKGTPTATQYTTMTQLVRERVYKFLSIDNMQAYTESNPSGKLLNCNFACTQFHFHYAHKLNLFSFTETPQITSPVNRIMLKLLQKPAKFSGCWLYLRMAHRTVKLTRHPRKIT